jgi:hypothetical protein
MFLAPKILREKVISEIFFGVRSYNDQESLALTLSNPIKVPLHLDSKVCYEYQIFLLKSNLCQQNCKLSKQI